MDKNEHKEFIKNHAISNYPDGQSYPRWFACSDDQYSAVNELVQEGFFKPLTDLVGNVVSARHWFIPVDFEIKDLSKIFTYWAINEFGIFELNLDYSI